MFILPPCARQIIICSSFNLPNPGWKNTTPQTFIVGMLFIAILFMNKSPPREVSCQISHCYYGSWSCATLLAEQNGHTLHLVKTRGTFSVPSFSIQPLLLPELAQRSRRDTTWLWPPLHEEPWLKRPALLAASPACGRRPRGRRTRGRGGRSCTPSPFCFPQLYQNPASNEKMKICL